MTRSLRLGGPYVLGGRYRNRGRNRFRHRVGIRLGPCAKGPVMNSIGSFDRDTGTEGCPDPFCNMGTTGIADSRIEI